MIRKKIDERLKRECALFESNRDVKIWVSKKEKVNIDDIYNIMIELHKVESNN